MKSIGISEFKSRCIAILKDLQKDPETLVITHRGKPVARIEPIRVGEPRKLGGLRHLGQVCGELVQADFAEEWEMEGR